MTKRILTLFAVPFLFSSAAIAQYTWNGAVGDGSWGTAGNWTNNAFPPLAYTGRVIFGQAGVGTVNTLETSRRITGTAGNTAQGLHYNYNGISSLVHTTDLNGVELTLDGGSLAVGLNASNCAAEIRNGTLILGSAAAIDVYVGVNTVTNYWWGRSRLNLSGAIQTDNVGLMYVGRHGTGNNPGNNGGILNLADATISHLGTADTMRVKGLLGVAVSSGGATTGPVYGDLFLPSSLTALDVGALTLGYERNNYGVIDFGAGSALTQLVCRGNFYLSYGANGRFTNFPSGVAMTIGQPGAPTDVVIAHNLYAGNTISGNVTVVNGTFKGYLRTVLLGHQTGGNQPNSYGILDLSSSQVFAPAENQFKADSMSIGSRNINNEGGASAYGVLKLPASVTNIDFGMLQLGAEYQANGTIDIGAESQLRTFSVTNALYWGGGFVARIGTLTPTGFVNYLPAGIEFKVGLTNRPAYLAICTPTVHVSRGGNMTGVLKITNGTFKATLSGLAIGQNRQYSVAIPRGALDLAGATLDPFVIKGHAFVGSLGAGINSNGYGTLVLPAGEASIVSNLYVGSTYSGKSGGVVDLNGTTLSVGGSVLVDVTGALTARVGQVSSGLVLASALTNDFTISPTGRVHIVFSNSPPRTWGLKMAGNQVDYLQALRNDGRLVCTATGAQDPQIVMEGGSTVVRIPPLEGSLILVR